MLLRLNRLWLRTSVLATLHCGTIASDSSLVEPFGDESLVAEPSSEGSLVIDRLSSAQTSGHYVTRGSAIEFRSEASSPSSGDVAIRIDNFGYDVHYDYGALEVIADGHGGALDREAHRSVREAIESVSGQLGANDPSLPLHEQMLFASLALLADSAGMALPRIAFSLAPQPAEAATSHGVDKSLDNDGVSCIDRDVTYAVSFDYGGTAVLDAPVTANSSQCNGQCGPGCTQLTPWLMWTLDCLEHDTCCGATSDDPCWTPLGECGDEYVDAEIDFLRGFDPFNQHCGG